MLAAVRRALRRSGGLRDRRRSLGRTHVLSAVRATKPDVVLLDLRMPELDGLACLERLRKYDPAIAVVILSSYSDEAQIEAARSGGALGYMVKTLQRSISLPFCARRSPVGSSRSGERRRR